MADWDERYRRGEGAALEPSPLLARAVEMHESAHGRNDSLRPPRALDIACGAGRHALALASRGFTVTAVDASSVALDILCERAKTCGVRVDARLADLERDDFEFEEEAYDLVCDFYFLQRELFPRIRAAVRTGGLLVAAIHMFDDDPEIRPMNPAFLLRPGELRGEFADWEMLHYDEVKERARDGARRTRRTAELIARRPSRANPLRPDELMGDPKFFEDPVGRVRERVAAPGVRERAHMRRG